MEKFYLKCVEWKPTIAKFFHDGSYPCEEKFISRTKVERRIWEYAAPITQQAAAELLGLPVKYQQHMSHFLNKAYTIYVTDYFNTAWAVYEHDGIWWIIKTDHFKEWLKQARLAGRPDPHERGERPSPEVL